MKAMASGNHLDVQREERWPNHTLQAPPGESNVGKGVKVAFSEWEEEYNSDEDDFPMYKPQSTGTIDPTPQKEPEVEVKDSLWS